MRASLVVIVLFISVISGISQCNEYYQLSNGSEWEMESYNAKGKLTGKQSQKVIDFTSGANSFSATVHSVVFDQKNKELMQGDLKFECKDGTMVVDMRNFINEEQMKAFQSYEMQIESDNLEIPNKIISTYTKENNEDYIFIFSKDEDSNYFLTTLSLKEPKIPSLSN